MSEPKYGLSMGSTWKIILILLGIIQSGFIVWAKWISGEVIEYRSERGTIEMNIKYIREDLNYLKGKFDRVDFNNRRSR